jgi:hypothetical protein
LRRNVGIGFVFHKRLHWDLISKWRRAVFPETLII